MEDNKPIDGAEYISLEDAKRLRRPQVTTSMSLWI